MFAPKGNDRAGAGRRVLFGVGLGSLAGFLALVALVLFVATQLVVSPQELYHRTWVKTAEHIFDPQTMGNWQSWEHKYDGQIQTDEDAVKYANEMLKSLNDHYTYLMPPAAVSKESEQEQGNFTGVGMVFDFKQGPDGKPLEDGHGNPVPNTDASGHPLISKVMKGGPAEQSGISPGDALVSVNGKETSGMPLDAIVKEVRGQEGTTVTVVVAHQGTSKNITLTRSKIKIPAVTTKMLDGGIGYLRLEDFVQFDASDAVARGLDELKDAKAIIFDLRSNPGGLVGNAINISSMFVKEGTLVVIKSRIPGDPSHPEYETVTIKAGSNGMVQEGTSTAKPNDVDRETGDRYPYRINGRPVVILVNGNSASASEMTTGAIRDNGAATVIGTKTFGKGIGQSSVRMPNGTQLHVTSLRYYTPSGAWLGDGGNSVQDGIKPDIEVQPKKAFFEFGSADDNQLDSAVDFLKKKLGGQHP